MWARGVCPPNAEASGTEEKGLRVFPFLEPEARFLNEPARTDRLCASRLVQKTMLWVEFWHLCVRWGVCSLFLEPEGCFLYEPARTDRL